MREWEQLGFEVKVTCGTSNIISADVAINHVDLTTTPDKYIEYLQNYPVVINGKVIDISKRILSRQLLRPEDDYDGQVVIKTNDNCGGIGEKKMVLSGHLRYKIYRKLHDAINIFSGIENLVKVPTLKGADYPIFNSIADVPYDVWINRNLVVEKFLPEQDVNGNYHLRAWSFLGGKSLNVLTTASVPIVKGPLIFRREILDEDVPKELISIRERLGFDYGRFDYSIVNGQPVLYDVNRTPTTSSKALVAYSHQIKDLAKGIYSF